MSAGRVAGEGLPVWKCDKYYPEYESVKRLSRETGRSYQDIYQDTVFCVPDDGEKVTFLICGKAYQSEGMDHKI